MSNSDEKYEFEYEYDNNYVESSSNIHLRFIEQPKLSLQEPVNLDVEEGETRIFQCQVCFFNAQFPKINMIP